MINYNYEFTEFLNSIEDMDFAEAFIKTQEELSTAEPIANRELRKTQNQQNYQRIKYARQLKDLAFWFHSCMKPAGLSDSEFQLIKPFCEKLVAKGQLKSSALSFFDTHPN